VPSTMFARITIRSVVIVLMTAISVSWISPVSAHETADKIKVVFDIDKFKAFVQAVWPDAQARGVERETFDAAFADVRPIPRVIELDRHQPEFKLTFAQYLARVAPKSRVQKGRKRLAENREILIKVGKKYGVQPRFIVALWGIETDFGRVTGGFPVISSLATLAFDGRRSKYFRGELLNALEILQQGHITPKAMVGSWAGAMGQSQFMPSSFKAYAIDGDGDGKKDIWGSKADVFSSAAKYLSSVGWREDQTWGRAVKLPDGFDLKLATLKQSRKLAEWQALGVRKIDGTDLPARQLKASLVLPNKSRPQPAYLVYGNYRSIMHWNRSTYFALTVGTLADGIGRR